MGLRLTKQQRKYQEEVLAKNGLAATFNPSSVLVGDLAYALKIEQETCMSLSEKLTAEKSKSIWRIFRERYF